MTEELGKLKRTLSKKCNICFNTLQLRIRDIDTLVKGEIIKIPEEYEYCPRCGYEHEVEVKIKRKKLFSKIELVEKEEVKNYKSRDYKQKFNKKG